jgi:antitoxin HicB
MIQENENIDSSFNNFAAPEAVLARSEEQTLKQLLAQQIAAAMQQDKLTKSEMALRMQTSRRALDRLLDPNNTSVTLHTLQRAAAAVGRQLRLELV